MELPDYFLADLPDGSTLTPTLIFDACTTLKRNRERFLLTRSTDSIIQRLAAIAKDWLDSDFVIRKAVLQNGPAITGFSKETLASGLIAFFSQITKPSLDSLLAQDIGSPRRLDEIVSDQNQPPTSRSSVVHGPELIAHFTGGVLPNPVLTSMILGLLTKSSQFFKCATGTSFIPRMFAHSLYMADPKLASCLEVAEWKGGTDALEAELCREATCVTVTGSDEAIDAIRKKVTVKKRFLGYGHKLSFGYVAREMLTRINLTAIISSAADDLVAWNQLGCLSPHIIYVESGGVLPAHEFAELLAKELSEREHVEPRGAVSDDVAAAIARRRMFYEVRTAAAAQTKLWQSEGSTAWTVVYEDDPQWQTSCLNRFAYIKSVASLSQTLQAITPIQSHLSTVGLAAPANRTREIALEFSRFGATRICRLGQMQNPPLAWRHDGRPALGDLLTWTDFELE